MHLACRGQRPRLQHCSNANFSITFFAPLKAMAKNGTTFETTLFGLVWCPRRTNGSTPVKSNPDAVAAGADRGRVHVITRWTAEVTALRYSSSKITRSMCE